MQSNTTLRTYCQKNIFTKLTHRLYTFQVVPVSSLYMGPCRRQCFLGLIYSSLLEVQAPSEFNVKNKITIDSGFRTFKVAPSGPSNRCRLFTNLSLFLTIPPILMISACIQEQEISRSELKYLSLFT